MRGINIPLLPSFAADQNPAAVFAERIESQKEIYLVQGTLLLAYMLYPNNETRRDQLVAAVEPVRQHYLSWSGKQDPTFFERFGGVDALSGATRELLFSQAEEVTEREWSRVGRLLRLVADIANDEHGQTIRGGASLRKAMEIMSKLPPCYQPSSVKRAWKEFRDVAHFLAAADYLIEGANAYLAQGYPRAFHVDVPVFAPDILLSVTLSFQIFGLSHRPDTKTCPILGPETLWRIPSHLGVLPLRLPTKPLGEAQLAVLCA